MNFADRICAIVDSLGPLVVGLDPHLQYWPRFIMERHCGGQSVTFENVASAIQEGNHILLDELLNVVGILKIQMAFYEMLGIPGMQALAETCREARARGYLVILDGKRNDIGSTARGYATGYLSSVKLLQNRELPAFWKVDAVTVNPYLGPDGLTPFMEEAARSDKGVFVLCRTSNPSASFVQDEGENKKVFFKVAELVEDLGKEMMGERGFSPYGIVVGATYPEDMNALRKKHPSLLFLIPGIGAQRADIDALRVAFRSDGQGSLINVSRDILYAYRDDRDSSGRHFGKSARNKALEYQDRFRQLMGRAE